MASGTSLSYVVGFLCPKLRHQFLTQSNKRTQGHHCQGTRLSPGSDQHPKCLDSLCSLVAAAVGVAASAGFATGPGVAKPRLVGKTRAVGSERVRETGDELGRTGGADHMMSLLQNRVAEDPAQHPLVDRCPLALIEASLERATLLGDVPDIFNGAQVHRVGVQAVGQALRGKGAEEGVGGYVVGLAFVSDDA